MFEVTDPRTAQAILDSSPRRSSRRYDHNAAGRYLRVELTTRRYVCPTNGARRWAVVLRSDELVIWGDGTQREACRFYADLVRECEDDYVSDGSHAWHETDVPRIPVLTA